MPLDKQNRAKVVSFFCHLGFTQQAIADHLHVSLAVVTRSIALARHLDYLGPSVPVLRLPIEELDAILPYVSNPVLSEALQARVAPFGVARVRVIPSSPRPRENARRVAVACSELLYRAITTFVDRPQVIGLTWGLMLRAMIDATHLPAVPPRSLTLLPVSGELSILPTDSRFERATCCSSNRLVRDLAGRLGLPRTQTYSLRAPASIPRAFQDRPDALAVAWEMIERDPTVHAILGCRHSDVTHTGTPMLEKVGTLFTGIGALEHRSASTEFGTFDFRDGEIERLRAAGVVGDLNGHLLLAGGMPDDQASPAGKFNQLAVGASPADLRRIAERHRRVQGFPGLGVILGAAGEQKARAVLAACSTGAVNQLVVSSDAAEAMLAAPQQMSAA